MHILDVYMNAPYQLLLTYLGRLGLKKHGLLVVTSLVTMWSAWCAVRVELALAPHLQTAILIIGGMVFLPALYIFVRSFMYAFFVPRPEYAENEQVLYVRFLNFMLGKRLLLLTFLMGSWGFYVIGQTENWYVMLALFSLMSTLYIQTCTEPQK